jgi:outer membrane protein OmpA-like peptidoglycan-associated protein
MKRFLLIVFVIVLAIDVCPEDKKSFSKWSFTPEIGINKFDGDAIQPLTNAFITTANNFSFGVCLERGITPIWGMSLEYLNLPFKGINSSPLDTFSTKLSEVNLGVTINFSRMIFPQTNSKLVINGTLGIGLAHYNFNVKPVLPLTAGSPLVPAYGSAGAIPFTISIEYNINKSYALGGKVRYISYTKDNLEGVRNFQGVTNDRIIMGTLFLRYKINANNKEHLRNIRMNEFSPDEGLALATLNSDRINKLDKELKKLDKKVDNQGKRIDSIARFLSNDGPDSDGDGVPDVRDKDPHTPPNTPVDFWGRPMNITVNNSSNNSTNNSFGNNEDTPSVYFDFDRIDLDNHSLETISKIAARMKADPNLYVEVRGYCDYLGKNPYNESLSKRRADRVKAELVKIWKLPADHIISNGKGKIIEPRIKYRPNRRCDFFFDKQ